MMPGVRSIRTRSSRNYLFTEENWRLAEGLANDVGITRAAFYIELTTAERVMWLRKAWGAGT
jgi:hypothetical protein